MGDNQLVWTIDEQTYVPEVKESAPARLPAGEFTGGTPPPLDPNAYPNWRSYTAEYATVTQEDLAERLRDAFTRTALRSPSWAVVNAEDARHE